MKVETFTYVKQSKVKKKKTSKRSTTLEVKAYRVEVLVLLLPHVG
jgi:hypothetical protein